MAKYVTPTSRKKKNVALLLCVLFGFLGVHYFYVGRIGMGIIYLCTGGLCLVGCMIDLIKILTGSFKDNLGMYLIE